MCADALLVQLFNTYGDSLTDSQLLATYGFVPADDDVLGPNPSRAVGVSRDDIVEAVVAMLEENQDDGDSSSDDDAPAAKRARTANVEVGGEAAGTTDVRGAVLERVAALEAAGRAPPVFVLRAPSYSSSEAAVAAFAPIELVTFATALCMPREAYDEYAAPPSAFAALSAEDFMTREVADAVIHALRVRVEAMAPLLTMETPPRGVRVAVLDSARRLCVNEAALLKEVLRAAVQWVIVHGDDTDDEEDASEGYYSDGDDDV